MQDQWWLIVVGGVLVVLALYLLLRDPGPADVRERGKALEERYDINLPWWLALWRRLGVLTRIKLLGRIKEENVAQMSVLTTESQIQRVELESAFAVDRTNELRDREAATHQNTITVLQQASDFKVSPVYSDQIRLGQETAKTEVEKHREMVKIDLDNRWFEIEQDLKAGFIYAQKERQYLKLVQEYLFGLYEDRTRLENGNELAKDDKLKFLNGYIKGMEKDFREQQKKLFQAPAQRRLQDGDEDTESSRDN